MGPQKALGTVNDFVAPSIEPGEQIQATLSYAETGSSYWFNVMGGAFLGLIWARFRVKTRALVVTDRRVFVLEMVGWGRPKTVLGVYPRTAVHLEAFRRGPFSGTLQLRLPDVRLAVNFRRAWRDQAQSVADTLSQAPATTTK
jgi:hypothetical protein